jgi:hypothetical protein
MADSVEISLEELPDEQALEKERDAIQAELSKDKSCIAELYWSLTRGTAVEGLQKCLATVDSLQCFAKAWATASKLRELAFETEGDPQATRPLPLAKHTLPVTLHPIITIHCDPIKLPPLRFTLDLKAEVDCAILIVKGGKLAAIEKATLKPTATLSYEKTELKSCSLKTIEFGQPYEFANGGLTILV